MENKKRTDPVDKHLNEIKYRMGYQVSETPRYKPLIDDEYDEVPVVTTATQDGQPSPNIAGSDAFLEEEAPEVPDEDNGDPTQLPGPEAMGPTTPAEPSNAPEPQNVDVEELPAEDPATPTPEVGAEVDVNLEEPVVDEPVVDEIQNEIIRHNLEAMKDVSAKLNDLEAINRQLNAQLGVLNAKVEEVEEPTDAEKLMSRKDVSYPYYFNLNDFWEGSFFEEEMKKSGDTGIKELPDGTFIADFDNLPTRSSIDIKDSFNDVV